LSIIFSVEKRIWIDSYFDGKLLDTRTSWKIAKALFFPTFMFGSVLLIRYYLPPLVIYIVSLAFALHLNTATSALINILIFGGAALVIAYYWYLKMKLRFAWFLFLDLYGTHTFSYYVLFQEMRKLNKIFRSEQFKKALVINFGSDLAGIIAQPIIATLQQSVGSAGRIGVMIGFVLRALSEEASRQVISYGKAIALYLLYRQARFIEYGEPQKRNDLLYNLVEKRS
jgi:hypothetical protein